ncbi:MAG: GWxTD domain-containing protein [Acidobacteria bacterium]|nr:GWxTD domain-containing protein [Acidobacteriota bacterium]
MRNLSFLLTLPLFATLSAPLQDWGRGPTQWLMTKDEQRAWSQVKTDQQANDFIDLFWARRDPTPNTAGNEFKDEFEGRVRAADRAFAANGKRGSLTDRGRVFVVLGPPKELIGASGNGLAVGATGVGDADSGFGGDDAGPSLNGGVVMRLTARSQFTYDNYLDVGLARPAVVFIEDAYSHDFKLDPQQGNPYGAMASMAQKSLVHPELTSVPAWAQKGGLESGRKQVIVTKFVPGKNVKVAPATPLVTGDPGASRLTLLKNVTVDVKPMSGGDPFASLNSNATFTRSDELGYAFQLCRAAASEDNVKVTMKVTGTAGNHAVNMSAPAEEMTPEQIRASQSCYIVRAAIPLTDFEVGDYHLDLTVEDGGQSYNVGQDFKVQ